ncbi:hypothetical protein Nepgr_021827 [Nepenthes gracilis]|uniref:Protein TIFY n=1 Tax=Nepenthes gracilis TaxID=150966 RepID=A0AAD3T1J1_NEPGR|nr:hypothetical protein Nepgr_021827 [Nepenthes gracilis]
MVLLAFARQRPKLHTSNAESQDNNSPSVESIVLVSYSSVLFRPESGPESDVMSTGVTATRAGSVLDKPLHQLTEEDLSQVTREDCRRFLKEKGMRRPSWNKCQAIQQVISLKSLLEPPPNPASAAAAPPKASTPPRASTNDATSNSCSSLKELTPAEADASLSACDGSLNRPTTGPFRSNPSRELECRQSVDDNKAVSPRSTDATDLSARKMTIFYSGKVNVYDEVPADRARNIMHIAASPIQFSRNEPTGGYSAGWATPSHLSHSNLKFNVIPPHALISQSMTTGKMTDYIQQIRKGNVLHEPDVEGQTNRQVSLQRYREKKKDRGRFKSKRKIGSSSGLEMYLNHQISVNGQSSGSSTSSPSQPGQPHTLSSLLENQLENPGLSVDLNDKA